VRGGRQRAAEQADARGRELCCPLCAATYADSERFCSSCGVPLVFGDAGRQQHARGEQGAHARKIKPQYSEGRLVKVARASNLSEAEFVQGMLLEEGIPSLLQRARGFDVPDFLVAGPRDVMVPESGAQAAREALAWRDGESATD
jgi:hypothetical protein